jgi:hypothetical protein
MEPNTLTPKRKRDIPVPPTPPSSSPPKMQMRTNTKIEIPGSEEKGCTGSPRTKVANHFQSLQIDDSTVSKLDLQRTGRRDIESYDRANDTDTNNGDGNKGMMRKRAKLLEIPETPDVRAAKVRVRPQTKSPELKFIIGPTPSLKSEITENGDSMAIDLERPVVFKSGSQPRKLKSGGLARSYPSINRLSESKSRRKRAGTPPLHSAELSNSDFEDTRTIFDPERAAQTWHDDEITGHNPDDPDDDGEGINGIGFKPTAAEAYARTRKRKMQVAGYKNREAEEARARRRERRRGEENAEREKQEHEKKVRFLEAEKLGTVTFS